MIPGTPQREELADFLRTKRESHRPGGARPAVGASPRTPGLRREELAQLGGVSLTWYTWLEQARDIGVSRGVFARLAEALRLTAAERAYLFALAGLQVPAEAARATRWTTCCGACSRRSTLIRPMSSTRGGTCWLTTAPTPRCWAASTTGQRANATCYGWYRPTRRCATASSTGPMRREACWASSGPPGALPRRSARPATGGAAADDQSPLRGALGGGRGAGLRDVTQAHAHRRRPPP